MSHGIDRRSFAIGGAALAARPAFGQEGESPLDANVLRVLFESAETGFDPGQTSDLYSIRVNSHIFEALLAYDPLAVPVRLMPLTAEAMPQSSDDFKTWTVRVKPGTFFAPDPAFQDRPRELVAADYVFSFKRIYDPALKSPSYSGLKDDGILGLEAVRAARTRAKAPFDYDREVEGLRALDRYTLQFRLAAARPRFPTTLASARFAAVAHEVVAAYRDDLMAHPVGTGPYRLQQLAAQLAHPARQEPELSRGPL